MTTSNDSAVDLVTDEEVDEMVNGILSELGIGLAALRAQADRGRFDTESQRRAWFLISGLGRG